jgi:negative regulator of flagellin synthesis FlgM
MSIERLGSLDPLGAYKNSQKVNRVQPNSGLDSVSVSDEARTKSELYKLDAAVRTAPDVRMDRVEAAKAKLQDPNYINDTVLNSVADKLMGVFGLD